MGDFLDTSLVLPPSAASSSSSSFTTMGLSKEVRCTATLLEGPLLMDCFAASARAFSLRRTGFETTQAMSARGRGGILTRTLAARALLETSMNSFRAESRLESAECASAIPGHFVAIEPKTIYGTISG